MIKSLWLALGFSLALCIPATAQTQQCASDARQADRIEMVYQKLAPLDPPDQRWFLGQARCKLDVFPNLKFAIGECSCQPTFACAMVLVLRDNDLISPTDAHVLACSRAQ
jgi:hypothetical protein